MEPDRKFVDFKFGEHVGKRFFLLCFVFGFELKTSLKPPVSKREKETTIGIVLAWISPLRYRGDNFFIVSIR